MGDLNYGDVIDDDESEEEIDLFINTEHVSKAEELEVEIKQAKNVCDTTGTEKNNKIYSFQDLIYLASHIKDGLEEHNRKIEPFEELSRDSIGI